MQTHQETKVTKVVHFDQPEVPVELPISNMPPVTQDAAHIPSGGFQNQKDLIISEHMHHDVPVTRDQAIPSPDVTQERMRQGEILRRQSKVLSQVPCDDQQIHMPGEQCENLPPNGPDPIHEHTKPGFGDKIKGEVGKVRAWVNGIIHPAHHTDLPPQSINKLDNLSTQTQAGDSIKSDLRSELGANVPPTTGSLTLKQRAEIASVSKMPVDLREMGLTNKPVVVKADLPVGAPAGFIETRPYTGMPEEFKQEYFAKAGALQKEHITMSGKKDDLSLTEKIKDTAASGWEVAKEKASEAKEYLDDKYSDNGTWETIKEKASDAKEWVDEALESENAQKALDVVKEKANDAKEWAEENITKENTQKVWETVKDKASDAKEYLDENITGETTSKVWETVKDKTAVASEWIDDKLDTSEDLKKEAGKKITEGKKGLESGWEKAKEKVADVKTSLERKMSIESKDPSPRDEIRQKKGQRWEDNSPKFEEPNSSKSFDSNKSLDSSKSLKGGKDRLPRDQKREDSALHWDTVNAPKSKDGKITGERFSEKETTGWENWKLTGDRVTDMLEKKLRAEPEKSLAQREYEAAESTRRVKLDWGSKSTKDKIKDSFFEKGRAWNDMGGFIKSDF